MNDGPDPLVVFNYLMWLAASWYLARAAIAFSTVIRNAFNF